MCLEWDTERNWRYSAVWLPDNHGNSTCSPSQKRIQTTCTNVVFSHIHWKWHFIFFLQHKQEGESFILNFQIIHAPGFVKYLNKSKFVAMIFLTWHERAYLVSDEEQILIQCGKKSVCWLLLINHIKESDDYSNIHHKHTQIHKKDKNNYQEWCSWLIKVVWQKTWLWKCMAYKSNTGTTRYPEVTVHAH